MKILCGVFAIGLMLTVLSQSEAMRRRPTPPSGYRYARRPLHTPRRIPSSRRLHRVVPARQVVYPRKRIVPAKSIDIRRQDALARVRDVCPRTNNVDVKSVISAALRRVGDTFGGKYAVKSLQRYGREICSKCIRGRCEFDHNAVKVTATIATECRSRDCVCGVERYGRQMSCELSGWRKPGLAPYNIEIECDGRKVWPPRSVTVPARTVRTRTRVTSTVHVSTTKATTPTVSEPTSAAETTRTTLIERVPEQTSDEFDVSAEGPGSSERPAPIVLWDETTSKATVVYPDPASTGRTDEDIEEEGFLQ